MEALERIIELSQAITSLRARRAEVARQLEDVDAELQARYDEMAQYVPSTGANGNGHGSSEKQERKVRSKSGAIGYRKGSVAHRILSVLAEIGDMMNGMTGAEITTAVKTENKQVHAMLSRLVPAGHVLKSAGEGRNSKYNITDAGREALTNAKEGGSDDAQSTAKND